MFCSSQIMNCSLKSETFDYCESCSTPVKINSFSLITCKAIQRHSLMAIFTDKFRLGRILNEPSKLSNESMFSQRVALSLLLAYGLEPSNTSDESLPARGNDRGAARASEKARKTRPKLRKSLSEFGRRFKSVFLAERRTNSKESVTKSVFAVDN